MNLRAHSVVLLSLLSVGAFAAALGAGCGDTEAGDDEADASSSSSSSGGSSSGGSSSGGSSSGGSSSGSPDASTLIQAGTLEVRVAGGFNSEVTDASTCQPTDLTYVYERTTRALSWRLCEAVAGTADDGGVEVFAYTTGERTLTAAEDQPIQTAVAAVARATAPPQDACPTDMPSLSLRVFADDTTLQTFHDACEFQTTGDLEYATGLAALRSALAQNARAATPN